MHVTSSRSQWCASFLLVVAAAAHIPLIQDHLKEAPYVGWGFILLSVTCLVLAVAMLFLESPGVWLLSGAVCLAAVMAFLASRTVGLPQIGDDVGNWTDPMGFPAVTSEVLMTALAAVHLRRLHAQPARADAVL